jgi:dihydroxyacetone kinase phosphotransfer subunit
MAPRVGIVAVSHSAALAGAAVELAMQMVRSCPPAIECAAGLPDGSLGTDATAIASAISSVDSGDGVIVITDLGSAVMNAQFACELVPDSDARVVAAPFVEGLVVAAVSAAGGDTLDEVCARAEGALASKRDQVGDVLTAEKSSSGDDVPSAANTEPVAEVDVLVRNDASIHARPAAALAALAAEFNADVRLVYEGRVASARDVMKVIALGAKAGCTVHVRATGVDAHAACEAVRAAFEDGFGEELA